MCLSTVLKVLEKVFKFYCSQLELNTEVYYCYYLVKTLQKNMLLFYLNRKVVVGVFEVRRVSG